MRLLLAVAFSFGSAINYALAQSQARVDARCGYLSKGIYCFGGAAVLSTDSIADNAITYLDLFNNSGISTEKLGNKWTTITAARSGFYVQPRDFPQSEVLPDGVTMLLSGGWNVDRAPITSQSIAYNAVTNTWSQYANYEEEPFGNRQIYWASSVYVPEYGVGFYGGVETNMNSSWTYNGKNMSEYDDPSDAGRNIGYTSLTFLDITNSRKPWSVFPTQNNLPGFFSESQRSIFDPITNKIFFLGGVFSDNVTLYDTYYSLNSAVTFDMKTGTWGTQELKGEIPVGGRRYHTTTLLGSTKRDVLLYGGQNDENNSRAVSDYCYTLNLDTYVWKNHNITAPRDTNLIRTSHSTVTVNKDLVFVVFGKNEIGESLSSVLPLNVTDPSKITYLETFINPDAPLSSNNDSNTTIDDNNVDNDTTHDASGGSGLSAGATAGIAVGAVVGALLIFGAFFCVWKKNNDKKRKLEMEEIARQNEIIEPPVMEVDWEEIDRHDEKYPISPLGNFRYSPQLADDSATFTESKSEINTPSPRVIQPDLPPQSPHAIDDNMMNPSHFIQLQKPDGGI